MSRRLMMIFSLLCLATLMGGAMCAPRPPQPKPRKINLHFVVGSGLAGGTVQLDVIGASARSNLPRLKEYPVNDYWKKGDKLRRESTKKSFDFPAEGTREAYLSSSDEIWNTWLNAGSEVLVLIGDWPGAHTDRTGPSDPRRLVVSIDEREWKGVNVLEFLIQESGITLNTAPPPK